MVDNSEFSAGEPAGEFEITNGRMMVSDPCYERGTWCHGILENVKNGTWEAFAHFEDFECSGPGGIRVKALSAKHKATEIKWNFKRGTAPFEVGVDSGQAGFFNEALYPQGEPGEYMDLTTFYGRACAATNWDDGRQFGTVAEGVVSSSGFGDGSYTCVYAVDEAGQVVAVEIEFIADEDEEDYDETFQCQVCLGPIDAPGVHEGCEDEDDEDEDEEDE